MKPALLQNFSIRLIIGVACLPGILGCNRQEKKRTTDETTSTRVPVTSVQFSSHPVHSFSTTGTTLPNRRYNVLAPFDGIVIQTRNQGDRVSRGDVLMQFSTDQLAIEKQQLEQTLAAQPANWQVQERLDAVNNQIASSLIRAPFDMVVVSNAAITGKPYKANSLLMEAAETGPLRIATEFPAWLASLCRVDPRIDLTIDQTRVKCVVEIERAQKQSLSSLLVYIRILSDFPVTKANQVVNIEAETLESDEGYWLPMSAVKLDSDQSNFVFVLEQVSPSNNTEFGIVKKFPIQISSNRHRSNNHSTQMANQVFGIAANRGSLRLVVDGTHRIVEGQRVEQVTDR